MNWATTSIFGQPEVSGVRGLGLKMMAILLLERDNYQLRISLKFQVLFLLTPDSSPLTPKNKILFRHNPLNSSSKNIIHKGVVFFKVNAFTRAIFVISLI